MRLGTAAHAFILEPGRFADEIAVAPEVDRRTKDGKAEWQAFVDASEGKTVITQEQFALCVAMRQGVMRNQFVRELFDCPRQVEIGWRWTLDGVRVKCRWDVLALASAAGDGLIIDIKTTSDPSPEAFGRQAHNLGYHLSAWLYQEGARDFGIRDPEFLVLAVGTEPPHEAHVYEFDRDALALGEAEIRRALRGLRECRETGDWTSPLNGKVNTLGLPAWAYTKERIA